MSTKFKSLIEQAARSTDANAVIAERTAIYEWLRALRYSGMDKETLEYAKAELAIYNLHKERTLYKLIMSEVTRYAFAITALPEGELDPTQVEIAVRKYEAKRRTCAPYGLAIPIILALLVFGVYWPLAIFPPALLFVFMNQCAWKIVFNQMNPLQTAPA